MMKNVTCTDRFLRFSLFIAFLLLGYFWLGSPWNWLAYAVGAILFVTALTRICPVYRALGRAPIDASRGPKPLFAGLAMAFMAALIIGGSYASIFFSRKIFLEDFNTMNHFYKQTLFLTGQDKRPEAIANLSFLKPAFASFTGKYTSYRPWNLKGDAKLETDFAAVGKILGDVEPVIATGDLHQAHLDLEKVRPVFQDMFKRNSFSMLAVSLVDFHDAMETILAAANAKEAAKVSELYPAVSDKLKLVEAEANDEEIKAIRTALDDVLATAQSGQLDALPEKANTLKSNFVRVYLVRG